MATLGELWVTIGAGTKPFTTALDRSKQQLSQFSEFASRTMASLVGNLASNAIGTAINSVFAGATWGAQLAIQAEQSQIAFEVMLGSAKTAKTVLADLTKFAADTPFELPELRQAAQSLAAFGVSADEILPTLRAVGDISSGIGAPIGEIAALYGKAKVQGRLFAVDINQLTNRGIPVIQEFAKQFGVTDSAIKGMVEAGQIGFEQLEKAFTSLSGSGGKFAHMMERQSTTIAGLWSTTKDNIGQSLQKMSEKLMAAFGIKNILKDAQPTIDSVFAGVNAMLDTAISRLTEVGTAMASIKTELADMRDIGGEAAGAISSGLWEAIKGVAKAWKWINDMAKEAIRLRWNLSGEKGDPFGKNGHNETWAGDNNDRRNAALKQKRDAEKVPEFNQPGGAFGPVDLSKADKNAAKKFTDPLFNAGAALRQHEAQLKEVERLYGIGALTADQYAVSLKNLTKSFGEKTGEGMITAVEQQVKLFGKGAEQLAQWELAAKAIAAGLPIDQVDGMVQRLADAQGNLGRMQAAKDRENFAAGLDPFKGPIADMLQGLESPVDAFNREMSKLKDLFDFGQISGDQFGALSAAAAGKLDSALGGPPQPLGAVAAAEAGSQAAFSAVNAARNSANTETLADKIARDQLQRQKQIARNTEKLQQLDLRVVTI